MKEYDRIQRIIDLHNDSVFLWGARQVGKSTLVKKYILMQYFMIY